MYWIAILQTSQVYDLCGYNIIVNTEYNSTKIVCEQRRVYGEGANKISLDERSRGTFGKTYFLADYNSILILYSIVKYFHYSYRRE